MDLFIYLLNWFFFHRRPSYWGWQKIVTFNSLKSTKRDQKKLTWAICECCVVRLCAERHRRPAEPGQQVEHLPEGSSGVFRPGSRRPADTLRPAAWVQSNVACDTHAEAGRVTWTECKPSSTARTARCVSVLLEYLGMIKESSDIWESRMCAWMVAPLPRWSTAPPVTLAALSSCLSCGNHGNWPQHSIAEGLFINKDLCQSPSVLCFGCKRNCVCVPVCVWRVCRS